MGEVARNSNGRFVPKYGADEPRPCLDCEEVKPAGDFHVKTRNEDGTPRNRQSYCKDCARERNRQRCARTPRTRQAPEVALAKKRAKYRRDMRSKAKREAKRARDREAARRRRKRAKVEAEVAQSLKAARDRWIAKVYADPVAYERLLETVRERHRRTMAEIYADPVKHEEYLANRRIEARSRRDATYSNSHALGAYVEDRERVPIEPFLRFIETLFPRMTPEEIEAETGLNARVLRNMRNGQHTLKLSEVDKTLTAGLGRPDLLVALYPIEAA